MLHLIVPGASFASRYSICLVGTSPSEPDFAECGNAISLQGLCHCLADAMRDLELAAAWFHRSADRDVLKAAWLSPKQIEAFGTFLSDPGSAPESSGQRRCRQLAKESSSARGT
jgi:hypothetical protein